MLKQADRNKKCRQHGNPFKKNRTFAAPKPTDNRNVEFSSNPSRKGGEKWLTPLALAC